VYSELYIARHKGRFLITMFGWCIDHVDVGLTHICIRQDIELQFRCVLTCWRWTQKGQWMSAFMGARAIAIAFLGRWDDVKRFRSETSQDMRHVQTYNTKMSTRLCAFRAGDI
jgi:hypothetical protein